MYYKSLQRIYFTKDDFAITIEIDKKNRTLKVIDNCIGMTAKELEDNRSNSKSGSLEFKEKLENAEDINIIGQFGRLYSAFMVSDKVEVLSKAYGESKAYLWSSRS